MLAIFKREFLQYFKSPVGFVAFGLFAFLSGFLLVQSLSNQAVSISSEIISLRSFFVILVPIVTMGLLADDKKRGTDIIYYTSPISLLSSANNIAFIHRYQCFRSSIAMLLFSKLT